LSEPPSLSVADAFPLAILALCIWREARGEPLPAKQAVAWSIRNRVKRPGWWGRTWESVVLMPFQYSSFNRNDPNSTKFPITTDPSWLDSLQCAANVYMEPPRVPDPTYGADSYFDKSLDGKPPSWATDGSKAKTTDFGALHFFRTL
jgi:hypothetical protein